VFLYFVSFRTLLSLRYKQSGHSNNAAHQRNKQHPVHLASRRHSHACAEHPCTGPHPTSSKHIRHTSGVLVSSTAARSHLFISTLCISNPYALLPLANRLMHASRARTQTCRGVNASSSPRHQCGVASIDRIGSHTRNAKGAGGPHLACKKRRGRAAPTLFAHALRARSSRTLFAHALRARSSRTLFARARLAGVGQAPHTAPPSQQHTTVPRGLSAQYMRSTGSFPGSGIGAPLPR